MGEVDRLCNTPLLYRKHVSLPSSYLGILFIYDALYIVQYARKGKALFKLAFSSL